MRPLCCVLHCISLVSMQFFWYINLVSICASLEMRNET